MSHITANMSRFRTAGHLASWAGICPGHHQSAGKRKSGKTRHGNRWLRGALGTAAMAANPHQGQHLAWCTLLTTRAPTW